MSWKLDLFVLQCMAGVSERYIEAVMSSTYGIIKVSVIRML